MTAGLEDRVTIVTDNIGLNNQIIVYFQERAGNRTKLKERNKQLYRIEDLPKK